MEIEVSLFEYTVWYDKNNSKQVASLVTCPELRIVIGIALLYVYSVDNC